MLPGYCRFMLRSNRLCVRLFDLPLPGSFVDEDNRLVSLDADI
jgi:hypothetical protein